MGFYRIILAGFIGYIVDHFLTILLLIIGMPLLAIETSEQLNFANPAHLIIGLILPMLMTVIGGGVAGRVAPQDPQPAGALVGGFGLISMALDGADPSSKNMLALIIAQCVATLLASLSATLVARHRLRAEH